MTTGCTCTSPGWCARHKINKSDAWFKLCRTRESYFKAWEEGRGPGQVLVGQRGEPRPPGGPGTELKAVLRWFGLTEKRGCHCTKRARMMDRWGCDECERKTKLIVSWLNEEADKLNLSMSLLLLEKVVQLAIWRARRKEKKWRASLS